MYEHTALCGQLARAFGNDEFEPLAPFDHMVYVIGNHDAGWAQFDHDPVTDAASGLPYDLIETPAPRSGAHGPAAHAARVPLVVRRGQSGPLRSFNCPQLLDFVLPKLRLSTSARHSKRGEKSLFPQDRFAATPEYRLLLTRAGNHARDGSPT